MHEPSYKNLGLRLSNSEFLLNVTLEESTHTRHRSTQQTTLDSIIKDLSICDVAKSQTFDTILEEFAGTKSEYSDSMASEFSD